MMNILSQLFWITVMVVFSLIALFYGAVFLALFVD